MDNIAIEISNLVKYYDGRCILDGIDLKIPRGCIYGLLGRNGIGKTTLIRILLGLEPASRGRTFVLGRESRRLTARQRGRIGYVADLDYDGGVGFLDFGLFAGQWGFDSVNMWDQSPPYRGDLDRDGLVGPADLAVLVEEWMGP